MSVLAGRYELAELLGSGGMSRVVAAHDRLLHRRVAVKLLHDDLATDAVVRERLLREARAAASFTHPNAVAVYDVGEEGDRPFIVMELIEGRSAAEILRERGTLPVEEAVRITDGVLAALAAAHARGLVHRDVKPANVLIDGQGKVKLADFGIAKGIADAAAGLTVTGQVVGTPRYLSPEQAAGGRADARSDLYAAGVVCYEMLAGSPPFTGQHAVAVALAHQREPVPPLADARPDIPPAVGAAVHRALEKDPADRFASATQMREALVQAVEVGGTTAVMPTGGPVVTPGSPSDGWGPAAGVGAPSSGLPAASGVGRLRWWAWPAVATVVLVLLALAVFGDPFGTGDDPLAAGEADRSVGEEEAPAAADEPPAAEDNPPGEGDPPGLQDNPVDTAAEADPTPAPEPPEEPAARMDTLIADLSRDLDEDDERYGDKGDDLLEDLEDIRDEDDRRKQAREARKLMDEIEKWVEKDELDPAVGDRALLALEDFVRAQREVD